MLDISYNDLKQLLTEVVTDQLKPIYEEFELIHESISNLPTRTELNALRDDVGIIKNRC